MEKISKAFHAIFKQLGIEKAVTVEIIREKWRVIIGETISIHTSPSFFKNGQLTINVDSPEWLHELQFHQETILKKLNPFEIDTIRFKLGRIEHRQTSQPPAKRSVRSLTVHELDFVEDATAEIENLPLKEQIKKAIEKSLGSR
jgi:hypothetical protein